MPLCVRRSRGDRKIKEKEKLEYCKKVSLYNKKYLQNDKVELWLRDNFVDDGNIDIVDYVRNGAGMGLAAGLGHDCNFFSYDVYNGDGSGVARGCEVRDPNEYTCNTSGLWPHSFEIDVENELDYKMSDLLCAESIEKSIITDYDTIAEYGVGCMIHNMNMFNGHRVWNIDGMPTIITRIKDNIAKGYIVSDDFYMKPCYVVKGFGEYAHGENLRMAVGDLMAKLSNRIKPQVY